MRLLAALILLFALRDRTIILFHNGAVFLRYSLLGGEAHRVRLLHLQLATQAQLQVFPAVRQFVAQIFKRLRVPRVASGVQVLHRPNQVLRHAREILIVGEQPADACGVALQFAELLVECALLVRGQRAIRKLRIVTAVIPGVAVIAPCGTSSQTAAVTAVAISAPSVWTATLLLTALCRLRIPLTALTLLATLLVSISRLLSLALLPLLTSSLLALLTLLPALAILSLLPILTLLTRLRSHRL